MVCWGIEGGASWTAEEESGRWLTSRILGRVWWEGEGFGLEVIGALLRRRCKWCKWPRRGVFQNGVRVSKMVPSLGEEKNRKMSKCEMKVVF